MFWAVFREPGPAWDRSRPMREQDRWQDHADFMDGLADEGLVVLGGPVAGGQRFLLLCQAPDEMTVRDMLAEDPWTAMGLLQVASIDHWELLLGRLSPV